MPTIFETAPWPCPRSLPPAAWPPPSPPALSAPGVRWSCTILTIDTPPPLPVALPIAGTHVKLLKMEKVKQHTCCRRAGRGPARQHLQPADVPNQRAICAAREPRGNDRAPDQVEQTAGEAGDEARWRSGAAAKCVPGGTTLLLFKIKRDGHAPPTFN